MRGVLASLLLATSIASAQSLTWPHKLHDPFSQTVATIQAKPSVIQLHFTDPKKIKAIINDKKNNLLSQSGFVIIQEKKRRILVQDTAARVGHIKQIIAALDKPQQQLLLKARIVSVDDEYVRDLGVLFEGSQKNSAAHSPGAIAATASSFTMPIASLGNGQLLDVKLNALEKTGHAKVISSPEIVALNHEQATIESGDEVPYQQETANGGTSVAFKKAVLKLQVTPHILSHNRILLNLQVNQDKVSLLTVQGVPAIHTQQLTTQIELKNRQTFALGGIYETNRSDEVQGVPFLKDVPWLGYLFRTHRRLHEKREMLVFVTVDLLS